MNVEGGDDGGGSNNNNNNNNNNSRMIEDMDEKIKLKNSLEAMLAEYHNYIEKINHNSIRRIDDNLLKQIKSNYNNTLFILKYLNPNTEWKEIESKKTPFFFEIDVDNQFIYKNQIAKSANY